MEEREKVNLVLVGVDPGSVNLGIGALRFTGLKEYRDGESGELSYIPDIEILTMERWNLKTGEIDQPTKSRDRKITIPVRPSAITEKREKHLDLSDSAALSVARSEYIFQPFQSSITGRMELPILVVENQCDVQKTQGAIYEMSLVQYMITSSVQGIDKRFCYKALDKNPVREIHVHARKYGQRQDGSRERVGRKEKAVNVLEELLFQLGSVNSLQWLAYLNRLSSNGKQTHDMSDAILLALDKALTIYEEYLKEKARNATEKEEKRAWREEVKKIPLAPIQRKEPEFTDENLPSPSDCVSPKKKRMRKSLEEEEEEDGKEKKTPVKRRKKEVEEKETPVKEKTDGKKGEVVEKKKRTYTRKPKPTKESDSSSKGVEEMEVEEKKGKKKKSKYPKLLFDFTTVSE